MSIIATIMMSLGVMSLLACRGADSGDGANSGDSAKVENPAAPAPSPPSPASARKPVTLAEAYAPKWDRNKPAAPSKEGLGIAIGEADLEAIKAHVSALGLTCKDASLSTMVKNMKQARRDKMRAEGKSADAISSASWNKESPREKMTQVRWSCPGTSSAALTDHERKPSRGRLLFVLDSPQHAVRHVSFGRRHTEGKAAAEDLLHTAAVYQKRFGEAPIVKHELPETIPDDFGFPSVTNVGFEWQFGDLRAKVEGFSADGEVTRVYEMVEIPVGVAMEPLATAPADSKSAGSKPASDESAAVGAGAKPATPE